MEIFAAENGGSGKLEGMGPIVVAGVEVLAVEYDQNGAQHSVELKLRSRSGKQLVVNGGGDSSLGALQAALRPTTNRDYAIAWCEENTESVESNESHDPHEKRPESRLHVCDLGVECTPSSSPTELNPDGATGNASRSQRKSVRQGAGRGSHSTPVIAQLIALLRAVHHAGLLTVAWRANYQKNLRHLSGQILNELCSIWGVDPSDQHKKLRSESLLLQYLNQTSSAAVLTATNLENQDSLLQLFDTSSWLYDQSGRLRESCLDTDHWMAWYPGLVHDSMRVQEIIDTLPSVPASEVPWIVRQFENPNGWLRFRGAVHLTEHDILHVLLGRGLQDQDEAFVLGFAMGTAKRVPVWQYRLFRYILSRLYPEPYRVPRFLLPAFDLGVQAGKETGVKNLYRMNLKKWLELPLGQARTQAGIDVTVLRDFFRREQQAIPQTIASVRLPD